MSTSLYPNLIKNSFKTNLLIKLSSVTNIFSGYFSPYFGSKLSSKIIFSPTSFPISHLRFNINLLPLPNSLLTLSDPPNRSTAFLQIFNPNPVPGIFEFRLSTAL